MGHTDVVGVQRDRWTEDPFGGLRKDGWIYGDEYLPALRDTMRNYFADNDLDAMIFPGAQIAAPPIGQDLEVQPNGKPVPFEPFIIRNISPGSTVGMPGLRARVTAVFPATPFSLAAGPVIVREASSPCASLHGIRLLPSPPPPASGHPE